MRFTRSVNGGVVRPSFTYQPTYGPSQSQQWKTWPSSDLEKIIATGDHHQSAGFDDRMKAMCGRFAADLDWGSLGLEFDARLSPKLPTPSWNISPTQSIAIIAEDAHATRHLTPASWTLIPAWSPTNHLSYPTFNARLETIQTKRTWSSSARSMRALIPMTGYYEWSSDRQPWYFFPEDGETLLVAGLYSWWRDLLTCTILTRHAIGTPAQVHDRMPVMLDRDMAADWISPAVPGRDIVPEAERRSASWAHRLHQHMVRPITGDGPRVIEPAAATGHDAGSEMVTLF